MRRTLAFSLHECAKILGSDQTATDLFPILFKFLQDDPEVVEGVLLKLPEMLKVLASEKREEFIDLVAPA